MATHTPLQSKLCRLQRRGKQDVHTASAAPPAVSTPSVLQAQPGACTTTKRRPSHRRPKRQTPSRDWLWRRRECPARASLRQAGSVSKARSNIAFAAPCNNHHWPAQTGTQDEQNTSPARPVQLVATTCTTYWPPRPEPPNHQHSTPRTLPSPPTAPRPIAPAGHRRDPQRFHLPPSPRRIELVEYPTPPEHRDAPHVRRSALWQHCRKNH
mmetsp:Transcript_94024/g.215144  ORF Transcript_94024/g.215144 Transcript_94024/m.215144 type:complete len:211 (-) Transcript_94024:331-963(-)